MRMLKLLVETSSSSIAAAGATGVPDMRLPQQLGVITDAMLMTV